MAKISNLDPVTTIASSDLVPIVDVDDTRMGIAGTNKKITMLSLARGLSSIGNYGSLAGSSYSRVTTETDGLMWYEDKVILNDAAAVNGVVACNGIGNFSTATNATTSVAGLMSSTDKTRLDDASGVDGVVKCDGSGNFSAASNATTSAAGLMSSTDKTRLNDASGVNGIIKCNGSGNFSAAVAGTDYLTTNISVISSLGDRSFPTPTLASSFDYKYIPTWAKKVTILFHGVSLSNDTFMVQLGTGTNTIFDSGYRSASLASGGAGGATAGFLVDVVDNGRYLYGAMTLSLFSAGGSGGYTWISSHACGITDSFGNNHNACYGGGTSPDIGAPLTWLRFKATTVLGLFDSGSVSVLCE